MELFYYGLSDTGSVRSNNEDYFFAGKIKEDEYLFIVADGMGGHQSGEVASRKAVSMFVQQLEQGIGTGENNQNILEELKRITININEALIRESGQTRKKNGMGTTLSALYIKEGLGYIVHVGDSRIYLYRDSPAQAAHTNPGAYTGSTTIPELEQTTPLTRLTEDHSLVGKLLKDGFITEEEARNHPKRNVLYQSIGLKEEINIQTTGPFPIQTGQKYLLCSDGLYGVVPDNEIKEYLKVNSTAAIAGQLVQRAKTNGGPDNITVIVVSTESDEIPGLTDTVKIITPPLKERKKRKAWLFILLGLLVLLLAVMIYFLVLSVDVPASAIPSSGKRQTVTPLSPKTQAPGRPGNMDRIKAR